MTFFQDLRYAVRTAARDKGFTTVAVLTLALGIGANTALFTIVNAVLLEPLPFRSPERLVRVTVDFAGSGTRDVGLSVPELFDLKRSGIFDDLVGVWPISANLTETDAPERIELALVDPSYFTMLGIGASLGRVFDTSDAQPGITEVAVISEALWRRRFGADPHVLGRRIRIDNDMYSIVGVAPAGFRHPGRVTETDVEVWAPAGWTAAPFPSQPVRRAYILQGGLGRLREGLTPAIAQSRVDALAQTLRQEHAADYPAAAGWALRVIPLHTDLVGHVRPALLVLLGAVGFVLLIACANVASLLLARASVRQREIAIRRAMGASRGRLVRQLLTESLLLSCLGASAGLLVAVWGVDGLVRLSPTDLPRLHAVAVNGAVLAFTAGLGVLTGIVFGFAPAIQGSSVDLNQVMRESARSSSGGGVVRMRGALVVGEFALALVLLVGAALLVQSFWRLERADLGFRPQSVLTVRLWLPQPNDPSSGPYFTHPARVAFYRRVMERVGALPGVESVGGINTLPLGGARGRMTFTIDGRANEAGDTPTSESALATPDYFRTLGIDLVRGRLFDDHDQDRTPMVAVVSERFAARFFPNENPIGRRFVPGTRLPGGDGPPQAPGPQWITIVGVVRDVKTTRPEEAPAPVIYRSLWQVSNLNLTLAVRAGGDPSALAEAIRREVQAIDSNEPVFAVQTMDAVVSKAMAQRRFTMVLLTLFAATALLLSAIGIYGVMAYIVSQRTREIGIRMALGATPRSVVRLVVGQGVQLAVVGVVVGIAGATITTRAIGALLYGVAARDPLTFAALAAVLTAVAVAACSIPARRATRVDPMSALRTE